MTNNFEKMMESMMEKYMEQMMAKTMEKMFSSLMTPEVAPAEVTEAVKPTKSGMTKEEFLALDDSPKSVKDYSDLDFDPVSAKALKYNGYVPSDIWTVNHLAITKDYGGKWSSKLKAYVFESHAAAVNFAQSYKIKTELTDVDRHNIKVYKAERAKAKAEYYAKKAAEMK